MNDFQKLSETKLFLVRHGESSCTVKKIVGGIKGCSGLSDLGKLQVQALAERIAQTKEFGQLDGVYSSVLPRAIETGEILISKLNSGLVIKKQCDLCELHPGVADGLDWQQADEEFGLKSFFHDPNQPLSPQGESWASFLDRVKSSLENLVEVHTGQNIVVATHGGMIDGSLIQFLQLPHYGRKANLRSENASITEWNIRDDKWRLVRYNDTAHLSDALRTQPH